MGKSKSNRSPEARRALELDSGDLLSIVEAAYEMDAPPDTWALEVLRATDRAIGAGVGVFACVSHDQPSGLLSIDRTSVVCLGTNDESLLATFEQYSTAASGPASHRRPRGGGAARCVLTSEIATEQQICDDRAADDGHDGVNILATGANDRGFLISLAIPANVSVPPVARRDLTRVATHVLAALGLRARLGSTRENRRRPRLRGQSTLTETERSAVTAAARGHSTKEIAYAFGIADATVRVLLMRAARRCGVRTRKELLHLWSRRDASEP